MEDAILFNKTSIRCSKLITQSYSTSFSMGIRLLDRRFHDPIYAVYGFVRVADEIVDTFLDKDRQKFLNDFKKQTYEAIDDNLAFNPVLHAFQLVVNEYKIERDLIEAFFRSMEMDLHVKRYDEAKYNEYIYGSAEVVGLICLRIFCGKDDDDDDGLYERLKEPARSLGAAFQKVNFLRDIKSDFEDRGRIYFPGLNLDNFDDASKVAIEKDIRSDFDRAATGIQRLPEGARSGVRMAYVLYEKLFDKIRSSTPKQLVRKRASVRKLSILTSECFFYFWFNVLVVAVPFAASFDGRVRYYTEWKAVIPSIIVTAALFMTWDVYFTKWKIWSFNPRYLMGIDKFGVPVEEWMFFFTVPYSCLFLHQVFKYLLPNDDLLAPIAKPFFGSLILILASIGVCNRDKLNTWFNCFVAVSTIIAHCFLFEDLLLGRFLLTLIIHYVPFFVCNGFLTGGWGVEEPIVLYNESEKINFRFGSIPVEDTIYSLSLLLMNVTLFETIDGYYS